ncbi:MAG: haloacid dehalogenase type II [Chloroflexota bacterium]|nr:haloacid dehalogenase type II [Chloroflexota bacterium]
MGRVIVCDVIETMLDLRALDPQFERIFGDRAARQEWFQQMLQSAFVATITHVYADFGTIGKAALQMTADRRGVELSDDDRQQVLGTVRQLPPHPDVRPGLERLRAAGFRLASLTNSTEQVAQAQLDHAGLTEYFEQILSVDTVQRFKPAADAYRMAAERLQVPIGDIRLVAAHAWDIAGALRAGCAAAFVARPGKVLDPLVEVPDVVGADFTDVATQIVASELGGRP